VRNWGDSRKKINSWKTLRVGWARLIPQLGGHAVLGRLGFGLRLHPENSVALAASPAQRLEATKLMVPAPALTASRLDKTYTARHWNLDLSGRWHGFLGDEHPYSGRVNEVATEAFCDETDQSAIQ
jgi:hypothetical protein